MVLRTLHGILYYMPVQDLAIAVGNVHGMQLDVLYTVPL